ncbi:uncharacterized protein EDB91DRAFT_1348835 [Suillus paluster]|uniref:uncharacterized protein n=1 Tax=Suillus paluster TaxID=48578 RepID=UPI001B880279|nr:uncharacterized protein EDB91DRAFT_1348835 [Suillus paluster]KAG1733378.1 hypothetical protein EDB91DRAFT_1348835 [Suillus paluster]
MPFVSNNPHWLGQIGEAQIYGYFIVASSVVVMYDYVLGVGEEFELIWGKRWSFMTFLYALVRYTGILYAVANILFNTPTIYMPDSVCAVMELIMYWSSMVVNAALGAIVIVRIYAMYQRSRVVLTGLIIIFIPFTLSEAIMGGLGAKPIRLSISEEFVLFGTYECISLTRSRLVDETWILGTTWELLTFLLAMWIFVKHLLELRKTTPDWGIEDCFSVLMKNHALYFFAFLLTCSMNLSNLYPGIENNPTGYIIHEGFLQLFTTIQQFILGPRLVISMRRYHAQLVSDSDMATQMSTIAFGEGRCASVGGADSAV